MKSNGYANLGAVSCKKMPNIQVHRYVADLRVSVRRARTAKASTKRTDGPSIDRPATLCEILRLRCSLNDPDRTLRILTETLGKLSRHQDTHFLPFVPITLTSLVKDLSVAIHTIVSKDNGPIQRCFSSLLRQVKNRSLRTVQTFDKNFSKDLTKYTKILHNMIGQHQKLVLSLQNAQEKCWISNSKFNKYNLMVKTARSSLQHLKDKLTPSEESVRLRAIHDLEQILKTKQVRKEEDLLALCTLRSKEDASRRQIIQLNDNLRSQIQLELQDRIQSAIFTIKELCEQFLPKQRMEEFSKQIEGLKIKTIVKSIMLHGQYVYSYPDINVSKSNLFKCVDLDMSQLYSPFVY
ncbi:hypothetical protein FSP39_002033 [Pinctada imbricata]|uniref:Uncharacterized protein n=1 Tax=Pinctada imbricata TaxID=66713 RepID=A0AA88XXQ8_PINIB|nr:hypothetical protein FSP39_002033 [Pinctada imbricata]